MLVRKSKPLTLSAIGTLATLALSGLATAQENNLSIELTGLEASAGPLYLSVQSEEDFKKQRGAAGGFYKIETSRDQTYSFAVPAATYAISVWAHTDNDGQFSMDENWIPTDGWAMSGTPAQDREPTFDETKIPVSGNGTSVQIPMVYRD